ncbi:2-succinyl-6-hydroxy-2,4-cyclohexadiene-1-carboxylate synthase [Shewanella colwelliana]|uniref:2-succinyl-6-hydroxy-2, 4-cyclohexadiene-1-carboxylate synthase n=1 Tax=Shewanella colwelliana TaxID=23 RepID=A0A1E5IPE1_SHECO|nr:alpha/beta fold hydrolase [Shewanella colwelliana]OEG72375.1 2-succinyl-6-hydroxy-2,4-cyclohexadiene-1-carboxylate synthase [Shewanella colwelliana]
MDLNQYRHTFDLEGASLSYLDIGQGPTLLLGHSYLWDSAMWAPQLDILSQDYRCIVPDLWAHGESDLLPADCRSLKHLAGHYLRLMDALDIDTFSVLGLSVGGMWGAELALMAPSRVQTLVMMGCFIGFEPEVSRAKYYEMLDVMKAAGKLPTPLIEQIAPLFFANDVATHQPALFEQFKQQLNDISAERIDSLARLGRIIFGRRDIMEDIECLTLPCLIMTGTEDKPRPILEGYLMHDAIDGSEFIHIPNAGHISTLEQPNFVNQHLSSFFSKHL